MKTKYLAILILAISVQVFSQQDEKKPGFMIFGVPQYIFTNGLRLDFDIHKNGSQNWFVISPYYYSDKSSVDILNLSGSEDYYDVYAYDNMIGGGLGLSKKTFMSKESCTDGFYLLYGGSYRYFDIDGSSFTWVEFTGDDGLKYQQMADIDYELTIHSMNANAVIGYQYQAIPSLFIDFYFGFGIRYSMHNSPQNVTIKYNRGNFDYGYTGTQIVAGVRFGIAL